MTYLRATVSYSLASGQLGQNVFGVSTGSAPTFPAYGDSLAAHLRGLWATYIKPYMPTLVKLVQIAIHEYVEGEGWVPRHEVAYNEAGTATGDPLPAQVSALVTHGGGTLGRRGKKYVPATTEAHCNNGTLSTAFLGALAAWGAALVLPATLGGVITTFGFFSMSGNVIEVWNAYNGFVRVPSLAVTQRRRRLGYGA